MFFKKTYWLFIFCIMAMSTIEYQICKAEIIMDNAPPHFAIVDYKIINSTNNNNIYDLSFQLIVKNRGDQPICNVKVSLVKEPEAVVVHKKEVFATMISSQETIIISDVIDISIKNCKQMETLPFTWSIEYDDVNNNPVRGEIIINFRRHLLCF